MLHVCMIRPYYTDVKEKIVGVFRGRLRGCSGGSSGAAVGTPPAPYARAWDAEPEPARVRVRVRNRLGFGFVRGRGSAGLGGLPTTPPGSGERGGIAIVPNTHRLDVSAHFPNYGLPTCKEVVWRLMGLMVHSLWSSYGAV